MQSIPFDSNSKVDLLLLLLLMGKGYGERPKVIPQIFHSSFHFFHGSGVDGCVRALLFILFLIFKTESEK